MKIEHFRVFTYKRAFFFNISVASFYALLHFSEWWPISVQKMGGGHNFIDTKAVLKSAECARNVEQSLSTISSTCNYQYGSFLLKLINLLHIHPEDTRLIGYTFMAAILLMTGFLGSRNLQSRRALLVSFLISISTGTWLLIERGNFDVLIVVLLGLATLFLGSRLAPLGIILLGVSALMKFYTLPLLFVYVLITRKKSLQIFSAVIALSVLPIIMVDLTHLQGLARPTFVAFGLPLPGHWLNFLLGQLNISFLIPEFWSYILGFALVVSVWLFIKVLLGNSMPVVSIFHPAIKSWVSRSFLFFASTYVLCFLLGTNYDYRLIYLTFALLLINSFEPRLLNGYFIFISLSALYFTYFFFGFTGYIPLLIALIGNISQTILAVYFLRIILVSILSQFNHQRIHTLISRI